MGSRLRGRVDPSRQVDDARAGLLFPCEFLRGPPDEGRSAVASSLHTSADRRLLADASRGLGGPEGNQNRSAYTNFAAARRSSVAKRLIAGSSSQLWV